MMKYEYDPAKKMITQNL